MPQSMIPGPRPSHCRRDAAIDADGKINVAGNALADPSELCNWPRAKRLSHLAVRLLGMGLALDFTMSLMVGGMGACGCV